jgi:spermidine dehydrogenase
MKKSDRKLGMNREITRRDFLNGASMAIGGSLLTSSGAPAAGTSSAADSPASSQTASASQTPGDYYPPRLTGMRGSHDGSFEVAHGMVSAHGRVVETPSTVGFRSKANRCYIADVLLMS